MTFYNGRTSFDFSDPGAEVGAEFIESGELGLRGLVAIEIANQTNANGDIIEIVAGNVTSIDLLDPSLTDLDLAIA